MIMGQSNMQILYLKSSELPQISLPFSPVVVAMPFIEVSLARQAAELMSARAGVEGLIVCVHDEQRVGFVKMANLVFANTQSAYFAYVAQDAYAGRQWLSLALKAMGSDKGLLAFNDGKWAGALAAFGLVRRSWAVENYEGALFHEGYRQHYEDAELTVLAMDQGVYAYEPNSVLTEVDWDKERREVSQEDRILYDQRAREGFGQRVNNSVLLKLFG
jgi:hypothetical protein